eukprot:2805374-Rhodomonas_salina.1
MRRKRSMAVYEVVSTVRFFSARNTWVDDTKTALQPPFNTRVQREKISTANVWGWRLFGA